MRLTAMFKMMPLAALLAGCTAASQSPPQPVPLVAIPGPAKTEAQFHADDTACRAAAVTLPASAPAQPAAGQDQAQGDAAAALAMPPGVIYLRCMAARQNTIEPLAPAPPVLYSYYPAYPIYAGAGFGFPGFYNDFGAFGFYGAGFGGFYGGYGYRGHRDYGFRDGGFRGGGFHGGGFHGGGFGGRH